MRRISPEEAARLMANEAYAYVDVRTPVEFDEGHPDGAYNVPWSLPSDEGSAPNPSFVAQVRRVLAEDCAIIVGCASGVRSKAAAEALEQAGFSRVVEQQAGMHGVRDPFGRVQQRGWREAGLPVSLAAQPGRTHREIAGAET